MPPMAISPSHAVHLAWSIPGERLASRLRGSQIIKHLSNKARTTIHHAQRTMKPVSSQLLEYQGHGAGSDKPVERLLYVVPLQAHDEEMTMYRYVVQHNRVHPASRRAAG